MGLCINDNECLLLGHKVEGHYMGHPLVRGGISIVVPCRSGPRWFGGICVEGLAFLKAWWEYGGDGELLSFVCEDEIHAVAAVGYVVLKSG